MLLNSKYKFLLHVAFVTCIRIYIISYILHIVIRMRKCLCLFLLVDGGMLFNDTSEQFRPFSVLFLLVHACVCMCVYIYMCVCVYKLLRNFLSLFAVRFLYDFFSCDFLSCDFYSCDFSRVFFP